MRNSIIAFAIVALFCQTGHSFSPIMREHKPRMVPDESRKVPVTRAVYGDGFILQMVKDDEMTFEEAEEIVAQVCAEFGKLGDLIYCNSELKEAGRFRKKLIYEIRGGYNVWDSESQDSLKLNSDIKQLIAEISRTSTVKFAGKPAKTSEPIKEITVMEHPMILGPESDRNYACSFRGTCGKVRKGLFGW